MTRANRSDPGAQLVPNGQAERALRDLMPVVHQLAQASKARAKSDLAMSGAILVQLLTDFNQLGERSPLRAAYASWLKQRAAEEARDV